MKLPITKLLVLKKKVKTQHFSTKLCENCEITDKKIISIFFHSTRIIRSISDSIFELIWYGPDNPCLAKKILIINIWYGPDNPCRVKKNTNNFVIGNFTILTQLCDFFVVFWPFFFNTNNFVIGNFTILTQLCDFFLLCFDLFFLMKGLVTSW